MEKESRVPTARDVKQIALETIEGLRNKTVKVDQANAISKLCNNIISTVSLEMEAIKLMGGEDKNELKNFLSGSASVKALPMTEEAAAKKPRQVNQEAFTR